MSKGPGRVERAIRALIERERDRSVASVVLDTSDLCAAAFRVNATFVVQDAEAKEVAGEAQTWTKAQRVSALRAIHRIIASEPGWTARRFPPAHALRFYWRRALQPKTKPQKCNETIWAYVMNRSGRDTWSRAIITSRGGARPDRVTVQWSGRQWQCTDYGKYIVTRSLQLGGPTFCHDRFRHEIERERREERRAFAARFLGDDGASREALMMLGLRRPFTRAEVERAFRTKSLKVHPDHGGDHDVQIALNQARHAALAELGD